MLIKEVRLYIIDVYRGEELIYSGEAQDAPEEIKNLEAKSTSFEKGKIKIVVE